MQSYVRTGSDMHSNTSVQRHIDRECYRFLFCSFFLVCQHTCAGLYTLQRGKSRYNHIVYTLQRTIIYAKSCVALVTKVVIYS